MRFCPLGDEHPVLQFRSMEELDRYIANSERAERLALQMTIPSQRDELLGMAAEWRRLADDLTTRMGQLETDLE